EERQTNIHITPLLYRVLLSFYSSMKCSLLRHRYFPQSVLPYYEYIPLLHLFPAESLPIFSPNCSVQIIRISNDFFRLFPLMLPADVVRALHSLSSPILEAVLCRTAPNNRKLHVEQLFCHSFYPIKHR